MLPRVNETHITLAATDLEGLCRELSFGGEHVRIYKNLGLDILNYHFSSFLKYPCSFHGVFLPSCSSSSLITYRNLSVTLLKMPSLMIVEGIAYLSPIGNFECSFVVVFFTIYMAKLLRKRRAKDSGISSNKNDNPWVLSQVPMQFKE